MGDLGVWPFSGEAARTRLASRWRTGAVAVGLLVLGAWVSWLLPAAVGLVAGAGRVRNTSRRKRVLAAGEDRVADLASLLEVALHGGVSLRRALRDVQPWVEPPLGPCLARALLHVERGASLTGELEALAMGPHPELDPLWRLVRGVERDGAPAAAALSALAADSRLERRHGLERSARRLPVRLLVPLMGGVLPAFVLLAVVPMLAGALAGFRVV